MDSAALHTASSVNAAGILVGSPNGMHVEQISKAANIDADTIGRILRYLATQHVFQEGTYWYLVYKILQLMLVS